MSLRSWAVGVVSTAAVVAGVVAVQSGIPGTAALPILPHRAAATAASADGAELPAPAEVGAPPPSAGTMQDAPVVSAEAVSQRGTDRPAKRVRHAGEKRAPAAKDDQSGKDPGDDSGKDQGKHGKDSGKDLAKDADGSGGPGKG